VNSPDDLHTQCLTCCNERKCATKLLYGQETQRITRQHGHTISALSVSVDIETAKRKRESCESEVCLCLPAASRNPEQVADLAIR
jgi:hypothetical protein